MDLDTVFVERKFYILKTWELVTGKILDSEDRIKFLSNPFLVGISNHSNIEIEKSAKSLAKPGSLKLEKWFERLGMPDPQWCGIQDILLNGLVADRYYDHDDSNHFKDGTIGWFIRIVKYSESATIEQKKWAAQQIGLWLGEIVSKRIDYQNYAIVASPHSSTHAVDLVGIMANTMSQNLSIPNWSSFLTRDTNRYSVKKVPKTDRAKYVQGIYHWSGEEKDRSVLLIDDVITTRSTAREITRTILETKTTDHVTLVVAARTADYFGRG